MEKILFIIFWIGKERIKVDEKSVKSAPISSLSHDLLTDFITVGSLCSEYDRM